MSCNIVQREIGGPFNITASRADLFRLRRKLSKWLKAAPRRSYGIVKITQDCEIRPAKEAIPWK